MAKQKVIIIGASTTGKTALTQYLRNKIPFTVSESDEELTKLNGGVYPINTELKMKVLAPKMVEDVLRRDKIIFFSNTHYFSLDDLKKARKNGFYIIQLNLDRKIMEARSKYRQEKQGYEDHTKYFDGMLAYQKELSDNELADLEIDADKTVEKLADEIKGFLTS